VTYRHVGVSEDSIDAVILESARAHGLEAAGRYLHLIRTAVEAIGASPSRPGSNPVPRVPGVRSFHLRLARSLVPRELRVKEPRHLVVYRVAPDGVVEILGIVHDRMKLPGAVRRAQRAADR